MPYFFNKPKWALEFRLIYLPIILAIGTYIGASYYLDQSFLGGAAAIVIVAIGILLALDLKASDTKLLSPELPPNSISPVKLGGNKYYYRGQIVITTKSASGKRMKKYFHADPVTGIIKPGKEWELIFEKLLDTRYGKSRSHKDNDFRMKVSEVVNKIDLKPGEIPDQIKEVVYSHLPYRLSPVFNIPMQILIGYFEIELLFLVHLILEDAGEAVQSSLASNTEDFITEDFRILAQDTSQTLGSPNVLNNPIPQDAEEDELAMGVMGAMSPGQRQEFVDTYMEKYRAWLETDRGSAHGYVIDYVEIPDIAARSAELLRLFSAGADKAVARAEHAARMIRARTKFEERKLQIQSNNEELLAYLKSAGVYDERPDGKLVDKIGAIYLKTEVVKTFKNLLLNEQNNNNA